MLGFWIVRRLKAQGKLPPSIKLPEKRLHPGVVLGAILLGIGWGLSGTCPGPTVIQPGEGHLIALATVGGILVGNRLYHLVHARFFRWPAEVCG